MYINLRKIRRRPTISQLFIRDKEISTSYTIMNFPSFYSPKTAYDVVYTIKIYDSKKKEAYKKEVVLRPFQSKDITFEHENDLPDLGIVEIDIKPKSIFVENDKHLGRLTPHVYARFYTDKNKSLGLIHPQTLFGIKGNTINWESSLRIDLSLIKRIVAYQINPTSKQFENTLQLKTLNKEVITSKKYLFNMNSAVRKEFVTDSDELAYFALDKTTTPNAKPLVFLYFLDGSFTVAHA